MVSKQKVLLTFSLQTYGEVLLVQNNQSTVPQPLAEAQQCSNTKFKLMVLQSPFCNQSFFLRFSKIPGGKKRGWQ